MNTINKKIIIIFAIVILTNLFAYIASADEYIPELPQVQQSHYVIYKDSNQNNRIEAALFDISDGSKQTLLLKLPLEYTYGQTDKIQTSNTLLSLMDNSKCFNIIRYYLEENEWVYFESTEKEISENATEILESDLPYFEVISKGKTDINICRRAVVNNKYLYSEPGSAYVSMSDGIHDLKKLQFKYKFPESYLPENYITNVEQFISGNGLNVIVGFEDYTDTNGNNEQYLEKYKIGEHSNSPIQVFDDNYDLINVIEYQGCFDIEFFYDGYFYMKHRDYSNVSYIDDKRVGERVDTYYKSTDLINRIEINSDDYTLSKENYSKSYLNEQKTVSSYFIYPDKLVNKFNLNEYSIIREESKNNGAALHNGYPTYCYFYNMDDKSLIATDISIDGVYGVVMPTFSKGRYGGKTFYSWSTEKYIYFEPLYMDCFYRLPISQLKNKIYVQLNDKILGFSQPPVIENDRTLVPMRFLFEQMGADVNWNEETQTATATVPINTDTQMRTFSSEKEKSVTFSIDDTIATVNGETATMDVPARLVNDKTMVPLRFLSENLGYNVEWDEATNTAIITTE